MHMTNFIMGDFNDDSWEGWVWKIVCGVLDRDVSKLHGDSTLVCKSEQEEYFVLRA